MSSDPKITETHPFVLSNSTLRSGLHRYAGDPTLLKLRLVFNDDDFLTTNPMTVLETNNQGQQNSPIYSSYILFKQDDEWVIKLETDQLCLRNNGFEVKVMSEPTLSLINMKNNNSLITENNYKNNNNNIDLNESILNRNNNEIYPKRTLEKTETTFESEQQMNIDLVAKSRRDFNWKDTTTVTSDNVSRYRTLARKLPYEMYNHVKDYYFNTKSHKYEKDFVHSRNNNSNLVVQSTEGDNKGGEEKKEEDMNLGCLNCATAHSICSKLLIAKTSTSNERSLSLFEASSREATTTNDIAATTTTEKDANHNCYEYNDDGSDCNEKIMDQRKNFDLSDWYQSWLLNRKRNIIINDDFNESNPTCVTRASINYGSDSKEVAGDHVKVVKKSNKIANDDGDSWFKHGVSSVHDRKDDDDVVGVEILSTTNKISVSKTTTLSSNRQAHNTNTTITSSISNDNNFNQIDTANVKKNHISSNASVAQSIEEINKQWKSFKASKVTTSLDTTANTAADSNWSTFDSGFLQSNGEILYIIMEKNDTNQLSNGESFFRASSNKTNNRDESRGYGNSSNEGNILATNDYNLNDRDKFDMESRMLPDQKQQKSTTINIVNVKRKEGGDSKVQKLELEDSIIDSSISTTSTSVVRVVDPTASSLILPSVTSDRKAIQEHINDKTISININNENRTSTNTTMMAKINLTTETVLEPSSMLLLQSDERAATNCRDNRNGDYESSDKEGNKNGSINYDRNQMTLTSGYDCHQESISFKMQRQQKEQSAMILLRQLRRRGCWLNIDDSKVVCLAVIVIDVLNNFIQLKPDLNSLISLDSRSTRPMKLSPIGNTNTQADNNLVTNLVRAATTNNISIKETRDNLNEQRQQQLNRTVGSNNNNFYSPPSTLQLVNQNQSIIVSNQRIIQRPLLYQLQLLTDNEYGVSKNAEPRLNLIHKYLAPVINHGPTTSSLFSTRDKINANNIVEVVPSNRTDHITDSCKKDFPLTAGFYSPMNGNVFVNIQLDIHFANNFPKDCDNLYVKYKLIVGTKVPSAWKLRRPKMCLPKQIKKLAKHDLRKIKTLDASTLLESATCDSNDDPYDEKKKLAQLSHSFIANYSQKSAKTTTSNAHTTNVTTHKIPSIVEVSNETSPKISQDFADDEPKKSIAKSTLSKDCNTNDGHQQKRSLLGFIKADGRKEDDDDDDDSDASDDDKDDEYATILESSTITSYRNSKGLFHFACVEELMLEFEYCRVNEDKKCSSDNNHNKWSKSQCLDTSRRNAQPILTELMVSRQQKSLGTTTTTFDSDKQRDIKTSTMTTSNKHDDKNSTNERQFGARFTSDESQIPITNDDQDVNPLFASTFANDKYDLIDDKKDNQLESNILTMNNKQKSTFSVYNSDHQSINTNGIDRKNDTSIDADSYLPNFVNQQSTKYSNKRGVHDINDLSSIKQETLINDIKSNNLVRDSDQIINGDCEIILLLEFYSSDFYHDKLQGWSYLSIPICLDQTLSESKSDINNICDDNHCKSKINNIYKSCARNCDYSRTKGKCECTEYQLAVIRPELGSLVDKLRYYLIGQLPKSTPKLKNFFKSNYRYMFHTKQRGQVVLNCDILRQASDPKFDAAFRHLLKINKQIEWRKQKKGYSSFDLNSFTNNSNINGEVLFDSMNQPLFESNIYNNNNTKTTTTTTTEDIVEAYQRTKDRIDRLNISSLLR